MKRILFITFLVVGIAASYSFAQMGQGHMGQGMMESQSQQEPAQSPSGGEYYPCPMGSGGYGMMGQGMMGNGDCGMMGPGMMGHMGGMTGTGMMGHGGCGMMGPGMMGHMGGMKGRGMMGSGMYGTGDYDPEAYQKFMNDTAGLRKKLHDKKFEYFETMRNPDVKRETMMKLQKEMFDLKWEIYEKSPQ